MKTYLYLSTAIISVSLATSGNAWAQCVSTQDCTTLGYTESSCPNGKGVKCPFGSKYSPTPAPAPDNWAKAKAALICINNAIAKAPINMPAPAPDTPVAPAPPVAANTPPANAHPVTTGMPPPEHASQTLPSVKSALYIIVIIPVALIMTLLKPCSVL